MNGKFGTIYIHVKKGEREGVHERGVWDNIHGKKGEREGGA